MFRQFQIIKLLILSFLLVSPATGTAADRVSFSSPDLSINIIVRKPEQLAAFYEARGFSKAMVNEISQHCFIGVRISNTSKHIILHDLNNWQFSNKQSAVKRLDRKYWRHRWTEMKVPLAHQSTFRWTMLPTQLDFRPNESEGGNILLPMQNKALRIKATFHIQTPKGNKPVTAEFKNIQCAK